MNEATGFEITKQVGSYAVARRSLPRQLQRRGRIFGLPIGRQKDYQRPWALLRDGKPVGLYRRE